MVSALPGATHHAEFYGAVTFYRLTRRRRFNTAVDHPELCWQRVDVWHAWENGKWVNPGAGWSPRRLQPLHV